MYWAGRLNVLRREHVFYRGKNVGVVGKQRTNRCGKQVIENDHVMVQEDDKPSTGQGEKWTWLASI